jgi:hypothetical protein
MKKGPNRRIVTPSVFLLHETDRPPLGGFRLVDFSQRPEAERDILLVHNWYSSYLRSEQYAPDHRSVQTRVESLLLAIGTARSQILAFSGANDELPSTLEFNAAISDLLADKGLYGTDMKGVLDETSHLLYRLDLFLKVLRTALSDRVREGLLHVSSIKSIRCEYYQRLSHVLEVHGLFDGYGQNSLLVQLVMRLDDTDAADAATDARRRKDLAREVKLAVKSTKGA